MSFTNLDSILLDCNYSSPVLIVEHFSYSFLSIPSFAITLDSVRIFCWASK